MKKVNQLFILFQNILSNVWLFIMGVGLIVGCSAAVYGFITSPSRTVFSHHKVQRVVEIGGCNMFKCGVLFDDGQKGELSNPVLGEEVRSKAYKNVNYSVGQFTQLIAFLFSMVVFLGLSYLLFIKRIIAWYKSRYYPPPLPVWATYEID